MKQSNTTETFSKLGTSLAAATLLAACGGGGGDGGGAINNAPPPPPPPPAVRTGVFKDSNVGGLDFESGQESGVTGVDGRFSCETNNTVTFSVGAVELGSADCATLVAPPSLVSSGLFDDPVAINIARFLLMLDGDEISANGISISDDLRTMADSWPQVDFAAADLAAELAVPISDIMSVEQRMAVPPDAATAFAHLDETLSCAYSGAFVGTFTGTNGGAIGMTFSRGLRGRQADEFFWQAFDPNEEFVLSTGGPYQLAARPSLDSRPFDQSVLVDATFDTPDSLSGNWQFPPESSSGTFTANRIGADTAEFRMTGDFFPGEGGAGVLVLDIDGSSVTGEAFEVFEGTSFDIIGTIAGTSMELQATGGGETVNATGVVSFDSDGTPIQVAGDLLGDGGEFTAAGCRLN